MLNQAIGRSRGGRTTKIHALTDAFCRPIAFLLTGGQVTHGSRHSLLDHMPKTGLFPYVRLGGAVLRAVTSDLGAEPS